MRTTKRESDLVSDLKPQMSDVTQILQRMESGDGKAAEELLPLVYEELRKPAKVTCLFSVIKMH